MSFDYSFLADHPHAFVSVTHCDRCYLQYKHPQDYDTMGNPIPAVPASPTGRNPSPAPIPQTYPGITKFQRNLMVQMAAGWSSGVEQHLPDLPPEPREVAPDFIGPRGTYKVEKLGWDWRNDPDIEKGYYEPAEYADANLVGSATDVEPDGHLPCIDLDLPAHLEPSTKPDHYHLYINKVVKWDKYVNLLNALYECGLINEGFKEMSVKRGQTFVRRPGVFKQPGEGSS